VRFVLAIVTFVIAALAIGLGTAERTFLAGPDSVTKSVSTGTTAPVLVIDGSALHAFKHTQNVQLTGSGALTAAYGRTSDIVAWIGNASYTRVTWNAKVGKLVYRTIVGTENTVPSPAGSDLWIGEYSGTNVVHFSTALPPHFSVIATADGTTPAPGQVSLTWPLDNSKPWATPLVIGGAVLLLVGLILLLWALTHMRRTRGPRRNQPKMPRLPRQQRYRLSKPKAIAAQKGRRAISRFVATVPIVAVGALVLAGCTAVSPSASLAPSKRPVPTATVRLPSPAVTEVQVSRIIKRIADVTAKADTELDPTLAATRLAGPALELRAANYVVRKKSPKLPAIAPIPSGPVVLTLPQQTDTWPRTVIAVVQNKADKTVAPLALALVQDDPRSNYKVNYAITLLPKLAFPHVAAETVGAPRLSPDIGVLSLQPGLVAAAYGDILLKDSASPSYGLFEATGDSLRAQVGLAAKKAEIKKLPTTARLTFGASPGPGQVIALATNDSGAIVAVDLNETKTVRPVKAGAVVNSKGAIATLSGKSTSSKGLVATYGDQLLFYVPSATDKSKKIVLLGFSQGLIAAKEFKK
jgi:hypothetical protein